MPTYDVIGFAYLNISHVQPKSQNHNKKRVPHNQIQKSGNVVHRTNTSFSGGIKLWALHVAALMSNMYREKYTHTSLQIKIADYKVRTFCSQLTLNLLTTTIVAPPSKASKWQVGFNSAFKGLIVVPTTQFISSFSHITLREGTEKSRYKSNYSICVGENLREKLRDQL
jgi:hypothetical protein